MQRDEDDAEWVVLPLRESSQSSESRPAIPASPEATSGNAHLDFQLQTWFGTLSIDLRPTHPTSHGMVIRSEKVIHPQEQSRLFHLPTELRIEIYNHVLRVPPATNDDTVELGTHAADPKPLTRLTMLLTCRKVLEEAEDIFYSINRISAQKPDLLWEGLGPRRRKAITKFAIIAVGAGAAYTALQQVHLFENLESLVFKRWMSVRFLDVSGWAIMAPQMAAELKKMPKLVDVRIVDPGVDEPTFFEAKRRRKLDEVDWKILAGVSGRPMPK